jgi:hypothetical protein
MTSKMVLTFVLGFSKGKIMKHLVILLLAGILLYGVWYCTSPLVRKQGRHVLARHALRLLAFVFVLLMLLLSAYYFPAIHLL